MIELLITTLATYGVSKLLTDYDGFGDIFYKLRAKKYLKMLTCTTCTSVWVATIFCIVFALGFAIWLLPFAIVATVIILERWS